MGRGLLRALGTVLVVSWLVLPGWAVADETESEPLNNRLKWSTASEVENFGYDVYRGDSEEGPFERVTKDPMPGGGTTDEPSYYEFTDTEIDPSRDYYYYVESIALDGTRERFTPIIRAKAKRPVESAEAAEGAGQESDASDPEEAEDPPAADPVEVGEPEEPSRL